MMKRSAMALMVFLLGVGLCLSFGAPVEAGKLPKMITFTSYKVGSLGYTITSGFREAIERKAGIKVRVEPYDTDIARILPLKNGESEFSILTGSTGTAASYGLAEFSGRQWGPQPIRQVWRGMTLYLSLLTRADSGIRYPKDLKGKRVPYVPGWPAGMLCIEGVMAFANLTWKDVKKVTMAGYIQQLKGIIEGKIDVGWAATVTPLVKELESGPHGAAWVILPHNDKEGWARLHKYAPWVTPAVCKKGPGIPKEGIEIGQYPYSIWCYDHLDADVVYTVVKALHEGYDIYKGMHKALALWTIEQAVKDPSPVPYHEGAIRYFREARVWTPKMDKWQQEQLEAFKARRAAFLKKMKK